MGAARFDDIFNGSHGHIGFQPLYMRLTKVSFYMRFFLRGPVSCFIESIFLAGVSCFLGRMQGNGVDHLRPGLGNVHEGVTHTLYD